MSESNVLEAAPDLIGVPRDLLAAACYAVRQHAPESDTYKRLSAFALSNAPTAPVTIEAALEQIAREHDLTTVVINYAGSDFGPQYAFHASVHWKGFSHRGSTLASAYGSTVREAIDGALVLAKADRAPIAPMLSDVTLTLDMAA